MHHCYLPQYRFSEDLDVTSRDSKLSLISVKQALTTSNLFEVRNEHESPATVKFERLWYPGILDQHGAIKVEIDRLQNVVLPAQSLPYNNTWGLDVSVQIVDIREICAEKIRAASQRARYRDFYDLYLILTTYQFDLIEIHSLIQRKEVRSPITHEAMVANWQIAKSGKAKDLRSIYCTKQVSNQDIETLIAKLSFPPVLPSSG